MNPIWDALNETCDNNEKQLLELEVMSEKLPKTSGAWFYLNTEYLIPTAVSLIEYNESALKTNETCSFVSVCKVRTPNQSPNEIYPNGEAALKEVISQPTSKDADLQDIHLMELVSGPNFPEAIKKIVIEMEHESPSLSESDAVSFCQHFLDLDEYMSEVTGVNLFKKVLYPVICNPDKMFLSILLLEKIRELANKYPIFIMNGVVIPVVSRDKIEKEQLDIVSEILKGMSEDGLNNVLRVFLTSIKEHDDSSMKLLTIVINKKPNLDSELSFVIINKLHHFSGRYSSNIQFGKLLLEAIPLLNGKVTEGSLKSLKEVLDNHNTFLKMPALKLFNELVPI